MNYELQSSRTTIEEAKRKLGAAASGFANWGGGYFMIGLDNTVNADGGWPKLIALLNCRAYNNETLTVTLAAQKSV